MQRMCRWERTMGIKCNFQDNESQVPLASLEAIEFNLCMNWFFRQIVKDDPKTYNHPISPSSLILWHYDMIEEIFVVS